MSRDSSAHVHPTVKPEQLRRDEVHFVVIGDDLHEQINESVEDNVGEVIGEVLLENWGIDFDEVAVELDREDR